MEELLNLLPKEKGIDLTDQRIDYSSYGYNECLKEVKEIIKNYLESKV